MVFRSLELTLVSLLLSVWAPAQQIEAPSRVDAYRQTMEKHEAKIQDTYEQSATDIRDAYRKGVDTLQQRMQVAGRLEPLLALKKEQDRFAKTRELPDENAELPAELKQLAAGLAKRVQSAGLTRDRSLHKLLGQYTGGLGRMQKELVQQSKIEEAVAARNALAAAKQRMTEIETRLPKKPPSDSPRAGPRSGPTPGDLKLTSLLRKGLIAYYPFDLKSDGKIADASGNNRHGTIKDRRWFEPRGKINGGIQLDGDQGVVVPNEEVLNLVKEFTFAFWVKFDEQVEETKQNYWTLVSKLNWSNQEGYSLAVAKERKIMHFHVCCKGHNWPYGFERDAREFETDRWYHFGITYKAGKFMNFYMDGEKVTGRSIDAEQNPAVQKDLLLGSGLKGMMDEIMVYERALSHGEIGKLYKAVGGK